MLVKCPKCGFDQPKDTYCAKCGIEMDSFKPTKPPLWKNFIKSPFFSLLLFIALAAGAFLYLKNPTQFNFLISSNKNNSPSAEATNPNNLVAAPSPTPSAAAPPPPTVTTTPPPPSQSPSIAMTTQSSGSTVALPQSPPHPIANSPDAPSMEQIPPPQKTDSPPIENSISTIAVEKSTVDAAKGPLTVEIRFIEAPMSLVQKFMSEAADNTGGDTGEMSYAIVKNSNQWLTQPSFKELDRFTKNVPEVKKKLQWFSGALDGETKAPIGLDFQVSIQERVGSHLSGDLFISRSMVEHNDANLTTQRKEFTTHFETDVGSLIGLAGIMPHTELKSDEGVLQDSLLKIFLSPSFQKSESELLILLQFKPK